MCVWAEELGTFGPEQSRLRAHTQPRTPGLCKAVLGLEEETFYEMSENRVESVGEAIGRQMLIEKS